MFDLFCILWSIRFKTQQVLNPRNLTRIRSVIREAYERKRATRLNAESQVGLESEWTAIDRARRNLACDDSLRNRRKSLLVVDDKSDRLSEELTGTTRAIKRREGTRPWMEDRHWGGEIS